MDLLNKAFAQAADLFRSMTPGGRITAGLLSLLVVISLGYLFQHQVSGPDVSLMHGAPIPASCLPAMEAAFKKAELTSYTVEGDQIKVPHGQQAAYMAALVEGKAVPPTFGSALSKALDADTMFTPPEQRRQRIKAALQEELSLILRSMSGIENACVLYDTEQRKGLNGDPLVTAAVSVKPLGSGNLDASRVSAIQYFVAAAIAGLKPENVVITDLGEHGRVYHGPPENGGSGSENQYLAVKQMHEQVLKAKILNGLSYISGLTVEPTVELDKERSSRTEKVTLDPKTVNLRSMEKTTTQTREGTSGGGRPGFQGQGNTPASLASATSAGKGSHDENESTTSDTVNEPMTREHIEKESVGLTPRRATVAVGVPSSYFEKVWRERNPAKEGEEPKTPDSAALEAIQNDVSKQIRTYVATLLAPLLPPEAKPDMTELVTVTTFQDIKPAAIPSPSTWQKVLAWLSAHWSTLGLIGLVLAGLAMLRSVVRGGSPEPATMSARITATPEDAPAEKESAELVAARRLHRLAAGGPSLRDELSGLVSEDPDAAANILRTWIGQAG